MTPESFIGTRSPSDFVCLDLKDPAFGANIRTKVRTISRLCFVAFLAGMFSDNIEIVMKPNMQTQSDKEPVSRSTCRDNNTASNFVSAGAG